MKTLMDVFGQLLYYASKYKMQGVVYKKIYIYLLRSLYEHETHIFINQKNNLKIRYKIVKD